MKQSIRTGDLDSNGRAILRIVFNSSIYGTQIKLIGQIAEVSSHERKGDSFDLIIDSISPEFVVSNGYLVTIDSDSLENVDIELRITDDQGLTNDSVNMKWRFVRNGRIITQTPEVAEIPVSFESTRSNIYNGTLNMVPILSYRKEIT